MQTLQKRLVALEHASPEAVTADAPTATLARFLARMRPADLMADLFDFSEEAKAEILQEIREHVPGYGEGYARS